MQEGIPYEKAQKHYHPSDVYVTSRVCLRRHFIWKREYCIQRYLKLSDRGRPQFYFLYFNHYRAHSALARRTFCRDRAVLFGCDLTGCNEQFAGKPKHDRCQFRLRFCGHARHDLFPLPVFAFCGALITTLLIFFLAALSDSSRTTIILAGITVSSFLSAGINTIKLLNTDITVNLTSFLIGSLSGLTLSRLILPCLCIAIAFFVSLFLAQPLNMLGLGDDIARSLGLRVSLTRFLLLSLASILAGCVVSFAGLLGFIGLIIPHICRRLFGNDARFLLPCSALLGGSFVLLCDLLGRILFSPFELPAGIIMSFVGGPFFLYLLLKKKGGRRVHA